MSEKSKGHHPWGIVAFSAAVAAGLLTSGIIWLGSNVASRPLTTAGPTGPDSVQNIQLAIGPPEIPADSSIPTSIEVIDATPNTFIDIEIAQPSTSGSGACSRIEPRNSDDCNLAYLGGGTTDADGYLVMGFPDPDQELVSGLYTVTIRDRHTATVLESYIAVK